jgi:hypothetical protein
LDTQPANLQLRKPPQRLTYYARAEHEPDTFGKQPPRRKRERQRRRPVQPLRVIHDAQKGAFCRGLREQAQYRQSDQESIRRGTLGEPENDLKGLALRNRKPPQAIEHRRAELVQACERQLHLGLDADRLHDGQARRRPDQIRQQRRLPDAGLTANYQHAALTPAHGSDQSGRREGQR